ncbi:S-adenosyl-L-methionine-dependent methyltransferase [Kockovaella imperatae]|uniref:Protein arginine methyltransferase NDUFAF7 n=1 Tax=Kockovaella imperatae TaxID=4999 RepID=A0A1Y1U9F9_9TREE|nr:S-adenosyl-L-methionine-dependent methyltransferase [Kockovaella imperatae]ORX34147.1 S-adenosyl-L-methionine-dependent methyltransferase [Kockovaella imperatae]
MKSGLARTLKRTESRCSCFRSPALARSARSYSVVSPSTSGRAESPLAKVLRDSIKATGPISVSRYMQWCLSHPVYGYYTQGDVFGQKGDFITSPEISQIFGELMAIWFVTRYIAAGHPKRCRIIELGPGRGTLMADILRTFDQLKSIASSLKSVHLVENSEKMRAVQSSNLDRFCEERDIAIHWVDRIDDVPPGDEFTFVVAHEFFDAMPINAFEKAPEGFRELMVDIDPENGSDSTSCSHSGLRLTRSREANSSALLIPATSPRFAALPIGARVEIAQDSWKIARKIGEMLQRSEPGSTSSSAGGAGLIVDYGADKLFPDSFRAIRKHEIIDVFDSPGESDLTANVDFAYLREAIEGTGTSALGPISQGQFLLSLGLQPRLQKLLASNTSPERKQDLIKGAQRLVDPVFMGSQYQIMGLLSGAGEGAEVYPFPSLVPTAAEPGETRPDS